MEIIPRQGQHRLPVHYVCLVLAVQRPYITVCPPGQASAEGPNFAPQIISYMYTVEVLKLFTDVSYCKCMISFRGA
jgi:hypothetical protein